MTARKIGIIFHGIGTPERAIDPNEAAYWIGVEQFETVLDAVAKAPERYCLSFDDANLSDLTIALPRLIERGLYADFFILTGRLGWNGSLRADDVRTLQDAGMGIGSHGVAHRDWRKLSKTELRLELEGSKAELERICERPILTAGIPFGVYNARVLSTVRNAGYTRVYSSDGGKMNTDAFLCPRRSIRNDMDKSDVVDLLAGHLSALQKLRRALRMIKQKTF